jgi:hypothetical protein
MEFQKKYAFTEPIPGEGASSFRGRQLTSGRDVSIHLLPGGRAVNESFLARIRNLPNDTLAKLVEIGEDNGNLYVVTIAPPYQHFSEWLSDQERINRSETDPRVMSSGVPIPDKSDPLFQSSLHEAGQTPEAGETTVLPPKSEPGEFTRMFQAVEPHPGRLPKEPVHETGGDFNPTRSPGEFTRIFGMQNSAPELPNTSYTGAATHAFGKPAGPQPGTPRAVQSPGEYTRIFARPGGSQPLGAQPDVSPLPSPKPEAPEISVVSGTSGASITPRYSNVVLTAILCVLSFLIGGALVFFILRH